MKKYFTLGVITLLLILGCKKDPQNDPPPGFAKGYVVFAWNDLGMHCLNPTYDQAVMLPPYNTVWSQVFKRGDPPQLITDSISIEYRIIDNTYSYGKRLFGVFWDNAAALFGLQVEKNIKNLILLLKTSFLLYIVNY